MISIYIRVSTEDQTKEGYSLEVQREYLEAFAKKEGWDIYKVYMDDGISGYSTNRPALTELLADAKEKKFELVLVYKLDRFSRNLKDLLNLVDELSTNGVGFKSATEQFDSITSSGKLMLQQLGSFAEFERNRIAERVFPGMIKGVLSGNWQGARYSPIGYIYNKEKKLLEMNEQEAEIVRLIYKKFISGISINSITEYLTRKGYRNRKGNIFTTKLIGDILKNRIYTGKLVWNAHHYDKTQKTKKGYRYIKNQADKVIISQGKHQPIISEADFELAQKIYQTKRILNRNRNSDYPLSCVMYCAKCNHKYSGISIVTNHRTGEKKRWYRCTGPQKSFIRCSNKLVKALDIENQVADKLGTLLKNDRLIANRWPIMTKTASLSILGMETAIHELKQNLKTNLEKQSKLTDAYLENVISEEVYKEKIQPLRAIEEEIKKMIALQEMREIEREKSKEYQDKVEQFLSEYKSDRKEIDSLTKKQVLNLLFKNIKIADKKIISFEFFPPFQYLFLQEEHKLLCPSIQKNNLRIPTPQNASILRLSAAR